jgi:hypothetical protein
MLKYPPPFLGSSTTTTTMPTPPSCLSGCCGLSKCLPGPGRVKHTSGRHPVRHSSAGPRDSVIQWRATHTTHPDPRLHRAPAISSLRSNAADRGRGANAAAAKARWPHCACACTCARPAAPRVTAARTAQPHAPCWLPVRVDVALVADTFCAWAPGASVTSAQPTARSSSAERIAMARGVCATR